MMYKYLPSSSIYQSVPALLLNAKLFCEGKEKGLFIVGNDSGEWGDVKPIDMVTDIAYPLPERLSLRYATLQDGKCYAIEAQLNVKRATEIWEEHSRDYPEDVFRYYVIGTAPFGGVAVWLKSTKKSVLLHWLKAEESETNVFEKQKIEAFFQTKDSLPTSVDPQLINRHMEQMEYRYVPLEEYWDGEAWQEYDEDDAFYDDIMLNELHVQRYDGTHHQLPDDLSLLKYQEAGMPKRLALRWDEGRSHLSAYWWMDDQELYPILHRFFSFDPGARADLLLRCDSRHNRFEMALKGGEIQQQPVSIPQGAYQLIVFKDGHELYKSPNFAQEDGAWNW